MIYFLKRRLTYYYREYTSCFLLITNSHVSDLSVYYGYEELDAAGMTMVPGKIYPKKQRNIKKLLQLDVQKLLKEGYTTVRVKKRKGHEERYETAFRWTSSAKNKLPSTPSASAAALILF